MSPRELIEVLEWLECEGHDAYGFLPAGGLSGATSVELAAFVAKAIDLGYTSA